MARRPNKTGRDPINHYVPLDRSFLETPAWRALSSAGKAVYPFVVLEWHGPNFNNNGKIRLSVRQAATCAGIGPDTAARAFQDLQAKGFLVVTQKSCLGLHGEARGPSFEITEKPMPGADRKTARRLFAAWEPGKDFPVVIHNANNPKGKNGNRNLSSKSGQERVGNNDVL